MAADVCPFTRKRCTSPAGCAERHCAYDQHLHPIGETMLSQREQYSLVIDEQRKERADDR